MPTPRRPGTSDAGHLRGHVGVGRLDLWLAEARSALAEADDVTPHTDEYRAEIDAGLIT
jgi:hypothetical protein